ncbi:MAG: replication protein P [Pseudomonadales bacterium]|nr:replication protein P [Pseudomonadales bacterium]
MKTAKEILGKNANALRPQSWTSTTPAGNPQPEVTQARQVEITAKTKTLINMVFTRFMAIYGHKFKSSFETESEMRIAKREWALSLGQYSEAELVAAVSRAKETLAWAPSIAEFIQILQLLNDAFGLPSVQHAYREACFHALKPSSHNWSHPVVYHAGRDTGWFELRSEEEKHTYPQFSYSYEVICRRFRQGEILEQPIAVAIEDKQNTTLCTFIIQWAQEQSLTPEQGSSLLYYMTKPKGSKARANFKAKSQVKVDKMELLLQLPE